MNDEVYLAIDFGTKRIGLAISRGALAEPLAVIANDQQTLETLADVVHTEQVTQIIVGLSENEMAQLTRAFGDQVKAKLQLPVIYTDETLSSYQAGQQLKDRHQTKPGQRAIVDSFAAANFLQEYLETI